MQFGRFGLKQLEHFCSQMHQMLAAGIAVQPTLDKLAERGVRHSMRPTVRQIAEYIVAGEPLSEAIRRTHRFPRLIVALVAVAERGGNLEGVFGELAKHYAMRRRIRNNFLSQITLPAIEVVLVIFILSIVRYVFVAFVNNQPESDAIRAAAMVFFGGWGVIGGILFLYWLATRVLAEIQVLQDIILRIPVVGTVRHYFAIAYFSWTMEMMIQAGGNIAEALQMALYATANGAFSRRKELVRAQVESGSPVVEALSSTRLFPGYYIERIATAEEAGDLEHTFGALADEYFDRAEKLMHTISVMMYWLIYGGVAITIIVLIFRFAMMYISALSGLLGG